MPTKSELVEILAPAIVQRTGRHITDVRGNLNDLSMDNLEQMYQKQVAAGVIKPQAQIDLEQAKKEIAAEIRLQAAQELDALREQALRAQGAAAAERELYQLRKAQAQEPQRIAEAVELEKKNRAAFQTLCRELNLSECEANYQLLTQVVGELTFYSVRQAVESNAVSIVPGTEAELAKWELEERERLARIIAADHSRDPHSSELHYRKVCAQSMEWLREKAAEIQLRTALRHKTPSEIRDYVAGQRQTTPDYPPMPDPITYEQIKRMDRSQLRELLRRYGKAQVDARCGYQRPKQGGLVRNINQDAFLGIR